MDIRKRLRMALLNEGAHKNEYGCVMVFLDADQKRWNEMQDMIDEDDLYDPKDDTGFGRETEPHVTILFGLHNNISDKDVEEEIDNIKTPKISFKGISSFTNPKFDVLKFDVESEDLHTANKSFTDNFPYTNDYPKYHPHCTIAYLKPKMADKYIKKLKEMVDIEIEPSKFVYSKADGTKKNYKLK